MKKIFIGRETTQGFVVDEFSVSRKHARLEIENGEIRLFDLNSSNGTFVAMEDEKVPITDAAIVQANTHVFFGDSGPYLVQDIIDNCKEATEISIVPNTDSNITQPGVQKKRCKECSGVIRVELSVCTHCGEVQK